MDLQNIAAVLEGLEETIIHRIIDRAQFSINRVIYAPGKSGFDGAGERSLLEVRLEKQEEMDGEFGRFTVAEERPFSEHPPPPKRRIPREEGSLAIDDFNSVNLTGEILDAYTGMIPDICRGDDDGHYGSSVEHDVAALQAISRRIHFGAFYVAESKFSSKPAEYRRYIEKRDRDALVGLLTRREVELKILERVRAKVDAIQRRINSEVRRPVDPEVIMRFYEEKIIPLTKEGELCYLLKRSGL